jgi:hypothetical protein
VFLAIHMASRIGLPQLVESRRNSEWFLASIAILAGAAAAEVGRHLPRALSTAAALMVLGAWLVRVPSPVAMRDRLVDYSGYSAASLSVVEIARRFEPFTWTVVSYGQEFPMVLGRGFYVTASEFLDRYDPLQDRLPIPTPHVFVVTERVPHAFEVQAWRPRFSRTEIERRLLTWCQLYRASHDDMRLFMDDGNVEVYQISRTPEVAPVAR